MNLEELVSGELIQAAPDVTMESLAKLMEAEFVGSVAIMDSDGEFVGIVTDRDIVRAVSEGLALSTPADDFMTTTVDTIEIDTEVEDAVDWLNATGYRHLPVTRDGRLVGMVSIKDLLWAITGE